MDRIKTIDAEVSGEALRLITEGGPAVPGRTMAQKLAWMRRHGEDLRTALMLEPRGHAAMHGALLTEPVSPDAHAGILFMHAAGFPELSGEGVIGAVTVALESGLLTVGGGVEALVLDTPAGVVRALIKMDGSLVRSVAMIGVPCYVYTAGLTVLIAGRKVPVDVAFSGGFYAIADSEAVGVPIELSHASELARRGREIAAAVASVLQELTLAGTILTAPPRVGGDLRSATILDGTVVKRSPAVASTAALLSVLDAMGLVEEGEFLHEGVTGAAIRGRVHQRTLQDDIPRVIPEITGSAKITGFHEFVF